MKRTHIRINANKLKQLEDYENLRRKLNEGKSMWWAILTPKHHREQGTHISEDGSRKRFMYWLENEIRVLKQELELEEDK